MQAKKKKAVRRPTIAAALKEAVLLEAGYKCANPVCRHVLTLELHHTVWVRDGGGSEVLLFVAHYQKKVDRGTIWVANRSKHALPRENRRRGNVTCRMERMTLGTEA